MSPPTIPNFDEIAYGECLDSPNIKAMMASKIIHQKTLSQIGEAIQKNKSFREAQEEL